MEIRNPLLDIALDDSLAEMDRARRVPRVPLAFLADIDEVDARFLPLHVGLVDGDLLDPMPDFLDEFKK
jgi:hypothetical protein